MSPVMLGLIGVIILILVFLIGMPVGFAMGFIGVIGFCIAVDPQAGLSLVARDFFETLSSYSLTVIPLFVFMGSLAFFSGMSRRLFDASYTLFGRLRGGLALATVGACACFAAICGSTSATAAAMGRVCLPEMKRYKYDDGLATGCVAAAGTLGILIPPSTIFVVYGILTEQSIGRLFIAGVLPGIMLALMFMIVVYVMALRNPNLAPAGGATTWKQKIAGLTGMIEMVVLFGLVIGGLFSGFFSPTQAAAAGCAGTLLISVIRRQLGWHEFIASIKDTLRITSMVMVIVAFAIVFGHFMAVTRIPLALSTWVGGLPLSPLLIMIVIIIFYIIGGCFMDSLAMITLTIPIIYPLVRQLGFDPIWFGVIIVLVTGMGVITPPVGVNVFVIKGVATDVPLETIFKGIFPFFYAQIVCTLILLFFPVIATFLPSFTRY